MRLWSVHPRFLDSKGLVALWREALLARKVLQGNTRGYTRHPQLRRFKAQDRTLDSLDTYLNSVLEESARRGYQFDPKKINTRPQPVEPIPLNREQLRYEWAHLGRKLELRSPAYFVAWQNHDPEAHPLFLLQDGPIEPWEIR